MCLRSFYEGRVHLFITITGSIISPPPLTIIRACLISGSDWYHNACYDVWLRRVQTTGTIGKPILSPLNVAGLLMNPEGKL